MIGVDESTNVLEAVIDNFETLAVKTHGQLIRHNIGFRADNLRYSEETGSLVKRKARAKYAGMPSLGTDKVTHAVRYYKATTSAKKQVIAYSTFLKVGSDVSGVFTNIKTGMTSGEHYTSLTFKDLLYLFNGNDTSQVYDGTNNTQDIGVPTPGAATAAVGAAGALTGAYSYKISYQMDGYQEGNAGVASNSVSPASEKIELSAIPTSSNPRVTGRHIYRTQTGGSIYYFLATISDNTTTTYSDNNADGVLTTSRTAPSDYSGPAENYRYGVLHKSRIFQFRGETNKSRGIYSDIRSGTAYPDVYPANNSFDFRKDDGAEITLACEDRFGNLIVGKANGLIRINTDADSPVAWSGFQKLVSVDGCVAPFGWSSTHIGVIYVSGYGESKLRLMIWTGQASEPFLEEFWPILDRVPKAVVDEIIGHYKDGFFFLAYRDPDAGTETYNNQVLIVNLTNLSWSIDDKNVECFANWNYISDSGELYTGSSDTTGFLVREDTLAEDIIIDSKADLDEGTYSQCSASAVPRLVMTQAELTDDFGATTVSAISDVVSTLVDDPQDTVAPSCTYLSKIYEINAQTLSSLLWNEQLGSNGEALFWVRTAATSALISSATFQGPYTTPGGSDLSGVQTNQFVQIRCKLYVKNADSTVSEAPNVYLELASGYIIKVSMGGGTLIESTIGFAYESHWLDFSWLNSQFKFLRKQFNTARIYLTRARTTGTLSFKWRVDQQTSSSDTEKIFNFSDVASKGFALYKFPIQTAWGTRLKFKIEHSNDIYALSVHKVSISFVPQPRNVLLEI